MSINALSHMEPAENNQRNDRSGRAQPCRRVRLRRAERRLVVDIHPDLLHAMIALAESEDIPLPTLVTVLINTGLGERLTRSRS